MDSNHSNYKSRLKKVEKKIWKCAKINGTKIDYTPMLKYSSEVLEFAEELLKTKDPNLIENISALVIALSLADDNFKKRAIAVYKKYQNIDIVTENLNALLSF